MDNMLMAVSTLSNFVSSQHSLIGDVHVHQLHDERLKSDFKSDRVCQPKLLPDETLLHSLLIPLLNQMQMQVRMCRP